MIANRDVSLTVPRGSDHRTDRPQRLGQDHALQLNRRLPSDRRRLHPLRRPRDLAAARAGDRAPRPAAHVPDNAHLRQDELPAEHADLAYRTARQCSSTCSRAIAGISSSAPSELLAFVGLYEKRYLRAGSLSFGQQKLLEFAMALMNEPHRAAAGRADRRHQPDPDQRPDRSPQARQQRSSASRCSSSSTTCASIMNMASTSTAWRTASFWRRASPTTIQQRPARHRRLSGGTLMTGTEQLRPAPRPRLSAASDTVISVDEVARRGPRDRTRRDRPNSSMRWPDGSRSAHRRLCAPATAQMEILHGSISASARGQSLVPDRAERRRQVDGAAFHLRLHHILFRLGAHHPAAAARRHAPVAEREAALGRHRLHPAGQIRVSPT